MQRVKCDTKAAAVRASHDLPINFSVSNRVDWLPRKVGEAQPSPMRLYVCRTQPQLHAVPPTPVAMVTPMKRQVDCLPAQAQKLLPNLCSAAVALPVKRPPSAAIAEIDCRPTAAKLQRLSRSRGASPSIGIATNPLHRRRSRDVTSASLTSEEASNPEAPMAPTSLSSVDVPMKSSASAVGLTPEPTDRYTSAVANVAFPTLTATTPLFQQTAAKAAAAAAEATIKRTDCQSVPREPLASTATPTAPVGGMSLTNWVRSTRCRLVAPLRRLRRSLSASRVDVALASSKMASGSASTLAAMSDADAQTPKRWKQSLQRLVQRRAGTPASSSKSSMNNCASPTAVSGRVLEIRRSDGTQVVRLQRPRGAKFGFFVSRKEDGVYVTRFNDLATQRSYNSVIGVGDQILEIEGLPTISMPLEDLHRFISDKRSLQVRVRSSCESW